MYELRVKSGVRAKSRVTVKPTGEACTRRRGYWNAPVMHQMHARFGRINTVTKGKSRPTCKLLSFHFDPVGQMVRDIQI